jgi:hypothetical protein
MPIGRCQQGVNDFQILDRSTFPYNPHQATFFLGSELPLLGEASGGGVCDGGWQQDTIPSVSF